MKNTFKGLVVALLVAMTTVTGFAKGNDPYFSVAVTGSKAFELTVKNVTGTARITIWNEAKEMVIDETIAHSGAIVKSFDLTELPAGEYVLQFEDEFKVQRLTLNLSDNLNTSGEDLFFLPVVTQTEEMVSVGMIADSYDRLEISIYNERDRLLHREFLRGQDFIGKKFDFSKVRKGNYKMVMTSNGHTVIKNLEIK